MATQLTLVRGLSKRTNRFDDTDYQQPRSNRFFSVKGSWYFHTREGAPIGPFDDQHEARQGLSNFLEFIQLATPGIASRLRAAITR